MKIYLAAFAFMGLIFLSACSNQVLINRDCISYNVSDCPTTCSVCPPCPECSSIKCQAQSVCDKMGFNITWYTEVSKGLPPIADRFNDNQFCKNHCGDGVCDDTVCQKPNCVCEENHMNCPEDC